MAFKKKTKLVDLPTPEVPKDPVLAQQLTAEIPNVQANPEVHKLNGNVCEFCGFADCPIYGYPKKSQ